MIMEEEKLKIPTYEEMREIIIEIKKDTKQIIKKIKEEEEKNNQENEYMSLLYDPCVIKFLCLILFIVLFVIIVEVINNNRKAY